MKRAVFLLIVAALMAATIWLTDFYYKPSENGLIEEEIALSDMYRYCATSKLDCNDLRVEERLAPSQKDVGHWEFLVSTGNPRVRYILAVLTGLQTQVVPFESEK